LRLLADSKAPEKEESQSEMLIKTNNKNSASKSWKYIVSHTGKPLSKDVDDKRKPDRLHTILN